ncbi:MAG TPA: DUF2357 domain-containing protein, partial [Solirubrobacteraceae bacterium]
MTSVDCGPYTIEDPKAVLADGAVELVAEHEYVVRFAPEAPRDVLRGALTVYRGGEDRGGLRFGEYFGDAELGGRILRVTSPRLSPQANARMLHEVAERLSALPFRAPAVTGHGYARDVLSGPDVLYQSYAVFRHAMAGGPPHDLPAAIERILARPHERLVDEQEVRPLAHALDVDGRTLLEVASRPDRLVALPATHPLARSPGAVALGGRLPTQLRVRRP